MYVLQGIIIIIIIIIIIVIVIIIIIIITKGICHAVYLVFSDTADFSSLQSSGEPMEKNYP